MDKIYFVEDNPLSRMNYAKKSSGFDHDVSSMNRPLLLELVNKKRVRSIEQRAHERFQVNKDAFALIRPVAKKHIRVADRSMAEIACAVYRSKPIRFGRIDNISMGGLSFRYIASDERSDQSLVMDLLVVDSGFYLENLTFKNIADFKIDSGFAVNSFKMRLNRVQFERLEPAVFMKLKHFVENYGVSEVQFKEEKRESL